MELTLLQRAGEAEHATAADEFRIISEAALAIFGRQDERYKRVLQLLEAGASIDAAMKLVGESEVLIKRVPVHEPPCRAVVWADWRNVGFDGDAATMPLALVAAALKARAAQGDAK